MESAGTVYLVDDEEVIRRSLGLILRLSHYRVKTFESGDAFLEEAASLDGGCVLLDVRMPGTDGLEVQKQLIRRGIALPVIVMTGHGDISVAVSALRAGAIDFIEKPFEKATLLAALNRAWLRLGDAGAYQALREQAAAALDSLSDVEYMVLEAFAKGLANQAAATALNMPIASVEICRATLIEKLQGSSLADALRIYFLSGARR